MIFKYFLSEFFSLEPMVENCSEACQLGKACVCSFCKCCISCCCNKCTCSYASTSRTMMATTDAWITFEDEEEEEEEGGMARQCMLCLRRSRMDGGGN